MIDRMAAPSIVESEPADSLAPSLSKTPLMNVSNEIPFCNTSLARVLPEEVDAEADDGVRFRRCVDELMSKVDELERKVSEVSEFYVNKRNNDSKGRSVSKEKDKQGANSNNNNNATSGTDNCTSRKLVDGPRQQVVCSKRMQELMRQFGTILRQISQHKWAWPFLEPVDVEGLGLHDYYEVIKRPMDFSTIRNQMEAKDGTGYKTISDMYADARLVFTNAMTYNDEKNNIHVMAKSLLAKLEEKWLLLWPKVVEEEKRQKMEEVNAVANMQIAHDAAMSKFALDVAVELNELNLQLDELRNLVVQKSRKWSTEEKRKLGSGLSSLSTENLTRALKIIGQSNPGFQAAAEIVEFDMDAQSETTLWRLKFFIKEALELQTKCTATKAGESLKRKKENYDGLANSANTIRRVIRLKSGV